jgi:hypothetical protein
MTKAVRKVDDRSLEREKQARQDFLPGFYTLSLCVFLTSARRLMA